VGRRAGSGRLLYAAAAVVVVVLESSSWRHWARAKVLRRARVLLRRA